MTQDPPPILVVDDDVDMCLTIQDVLDLEGFSSVIAHSGLQALDLARTQEFRAVLMDMKMPGLDGVETYRFFKDIAPHTPVIMMTAFAMQKLLQEALDLGACGALHKPLDIDELFRVLRRCIAA